MRNTTRHTPFALAAALALGAGSAHAFTTIDAVDVDLVGDGTINSITFDGGTVVDPATFVGATLTGFEDSDEAMLILTDGASTIPTPSSTVSDNSLDTGLANIASVTVVFDLPIVNVAGMADLLLIDNGTSIDDFTATVGGTTVPFDVGAGDFLFEADAPFRPFEVAASTETGFTTVSALDAAAFALTSSGDPAERTPEGEPIAGGTGLSPNTARGFVLIDLSDFGIAEGDTITSITFADAGETLDVLEVYGFVPIPEPGSLLLAAAGLGLLAARRRSA